MFLRSKRRFKNGNWHRYWGVVESRRLSIDRVVQRHGYSRDGRPDCRQVVIALVVTTDDPASGVGEVGGDPDGGRVPPTTDGRLLVMPRYIEPEADQQLVFEKLRLTLPPPPPRIQSGEVVLPTRPPPSGVVPTFDKKPGRRYRQRPRPCRSAKVGLAALGCGS